MDTNYHETVLVKEVIEGLHIKKGGKYIDATLGNGGHAVEILKLGGSVLGIDIDPSMVEIAEKRIKDEGFSAIIFARIMIIIQKRLSKKNYSSGDPPYAGCNTTKIPRQGIGDRD